MSQYFRRDLSYKDSDKIKINFTATSWVINVHVTCYLKRITTLLSAKIIDSDSFISGEISEQYEANRSKAY